MHCNMVFSTKVESEWVELNSIIKTCYMATYSELKWKINKTTDAGI